MIKRDIEKKIKQLAKQFPALALIGPRQSGKTTLVKSLFPRKKYVSLEDLDVRERALKDPRGFLSNYPQGAIFDEIQRVPTLFSYLQTEIDQNQKAGRFILTGSQNILLQANIAQSLAGRIALLKLLPLNFNELKKTDFKFKNYEEYLFKGSYPRLYDQKITPSDWHSNYLQTYVERDVRLIKNITDLNLFQKFIKLCASRIGQILNLTSLGNDCGINHNTARAWLSLLESSFILFSLHPYYQNFSKRLIQMPKIYFYDTGLAAHLLGIKNAEQLSSHYLKGGLFESMIISEVIKKRLNQGLEPNLYYWRDKTGNEIDLIFEKSNKIEAIEIKSGQTISQDFFKGLQYFNSLSKAKNIHQNLVYGGEDNFNQQSTKVISWKNLNF